MINNDLISTLINDETGERREELDQETACLELEMRKALISQLRMARLANNFTQVEIAEKMQTQKQNISRLEKGQFDPKLGTLLKYAQAVGMKITLNPMAK
ncbi:helix-turn-helix transcriptional regulator [Providencia vermicola]|uniref:helix-turn-helix transcriptional regulator n=1 Tax=Providencia vermicola TaxID=333965 RepID=UPI001CED8607|nr:helix-turn-helix transcriptional regulator [Providencia vermicola]